MEYTEKDNWAILYPFFLNLKDDNKIEILFEYSCESPKNLFEEMKEVINEKEFFRK
ncbi:hypothetical protein [Marinitoga sp. 38H-ov]|uniref:hypothetical protein n=1 Tax=Marinitoga sp. 38H-ov TaxID=1755814 RepID=UPI0013EBF408|nr:hypothetical protein [Marinitoga sp. 38H-ov]